MFVLLIIPLLFINCRGYLALDLSSECDTTYEFTCNNQKCIPLSRQCDGISDCEDNSDEEPCGHIHCDEPDFFRCKSGRCISAYFACDGENDCDDFSDESDLCKTSCDHECFYQCVKGPTGPRCVCPEGFRLENDTFCEDIDECQEYGICDQKCNNQPGSYECLCDLGYTLQEDKSCKADTNETVMVFAADDQIYSHRLDSESEDFNVIVSNQRQVIGVHFDGKHIYWTHIFENHGAISRSRKDGSHIELLVTSGLGFSDDLDVDYLTGNIYFTDSGKSHIGVCTNNGKHCMVLIKKDVHKPRAIVLNPTNGEMFWTDWGNHPKIARSFMDGSNQTLFVSKDIFWPNGLAIDHPDQRLYWTDAKLHTLQSITLDGKFRRIVLRRIVKHPFAIAVLENNLFSSDWKTRSIHVCDKFTGKNSSTILKVKKGVVYGLQIIDPYFDQKRTINPCNSTPCSHICLLQGSSDYACACPENMELNTDGRICGQISTL